MPNKFTRTDFLTANVEFWTPDHIRCGREFQCPRTEFNDYWLNQIAIDIDGHVARSLVIQDSNNLAAYITICAASLEFKKVRGHRPTPLSGEGIGYASLPAIKIGRLAADISAKKSGTRLLRWTLAYVAREVAPKIGVRFVTLEALYDPDDVNPTTGEPYDVSKFYKNKFGFEYIDPNETPKAPYRSMFLDLKPLIEAAKAGGASVDSVIAQLKA